MLVRAAALNLKGVVAKYLWENFEEVFNSINKRGYATTMFARLAASVI